MNVLLLADTREDAVIPFLRGEIAPELLQVRQITRADYAVIGTDESGVDPRIFASIERKNLKDYGASIRDGRMANKHKMLAMRDPTVARYATTHLYFIVEGPFQPSPDTEFGGVKYSSIENSIFHLMTEYGIMIIRTRDPADTARALHKLLNSYCVRPPTPVVGASETGGTGEASGTSRTGEVSTTEAGAAAPNPVAPDLASRYDNNLAAPVVGRSAAASMLFDRIHKDRTDMLVDLWLGLSGFGAKTALVLAGLPPLEVLAQRHNHLLGSKQCDTIARLNAPRWNKDQEDLLKGVPGIGKKRAIEASEHAACFRELWMKRGAIPKTMRDALEKVFNHQ